MKILAWAGLIIGFVYLIVAGGGGNPGTLEASYRLVSLVMAVIALGAWAIAMRRAPEWRPGSAIWPVPLAILVAFVISSLASWSLRLSAEMTAYLWIVGSLYLLLRQLFRDPFFERRLLGLTVLLGLFVSVAFLGTVLLGWLEWWSLVGRVTTPPLRPGFVGLTFGGPNAAMAVDVLLLAPSVAFLGAATRRRALASAVLVILGVLVIITSGSRGGWLGIAVAVVLTLIVAFGRRLIVGPIHVVRNRRTWPGLAVVIAVLAVPAALVLPAIIERFAGGGEALRQTLVTVSLRIFESGPIVGSGPATWAPRRASFTQTGEVDYYIPHAHNMYAQTGAEFGLLGLVAGLLVVGCLAWLIRRSLAGVEPLQRRMALAAFFSLAFVAGRELVDFIPNMPGALLALAIPIAWLDAKIDRSIRLPWPGAVPKPWGRSTPDQPGLGAPRWSRGTFAAATIITLVAIATLAWTNVLALQSDRLATQMVAGDWSSAAGPALQLAKDDAAIPVYHFAAGLAAANVGELTTARDQLQEAAVRDDFSQGWLDVAAVDLAMADPAGTRTALDRALRLGRDDVAVAFPSAAMLLQLGDVEPATRLFVASVTLSPSLAGDPYWTRPPVSAIASGVFDQAIAGSTPEAAFEIALEAGREAQAAQIASSLPGAEAAFYANVQRGWNGDQAAIAAIEAVAQARPLESLAVSWSARLTARAGDPVAADRYLRWLDLMNNFTADGNGLELRLASDDGQTYAGGQPQPGTNNGYAYGLFSYLRGTTYDILVPQAIHLVQR